VASFAVNVLVGKDLKLTTIFKITLDKMHIRAQ
jgi:hypothetical protein